MTQNTYKKPYELYYLKTKINLKQKINSSLDIFFTNFKGKITLNMNFPYQIEPFDTHIVCFGDLNRCHIKIE